MAPRHRRRRRSKKQPQSSTNDHWRPFSDMDQKNASFGRSSSMPALTWQTSEVDEQQAWEDTYETARRALQSSPSFQEFRNNVATTWAPDSIQFSKPITHAERVHYGLVAGNLDSNNTTVDHVASSENHHGNPPATASASDSPKSETTIVPDAKEEDQKNVFSIGLDKPLVNVAAFEFPIEAQTQFAMHYPPSPWNPMVPAQDSTQWYTRASPGTGDKIDFLANPSHNMSVGCEKSNSCLSPSRHQQPNHIIRTSIIDGARATKELNVPSGDLHHRRMSSRLSPFPPTPLSRTHLRKTSLGFGQSALASSLPSTPSRPQEVQKDSGVTESPKIFGLHARENAFASSGNQAFTKSNGGSHSRKQTDPFVDHAEHWDKLPNPGPHITWRRDNLEWSSPAPVYTPTTPAFEHLAPTPSSFHSFLPPPTHAGLLPIPPPPLSSISGKLQHTPKARARLDAQKVVREEWIHTEAKKIVELNQLMVDAAERYQTTGSKEDGEAWQAALEAFSEATDVDKRMEERRNLFMPRGVTAMRMALHNKSENESLDDRMANGDAIGGSESGSHGDKHLLGFELAAMERICAEVTRRDEQGDDEITSEMLATLSLAERRVLREHLVGRLDGGANNNA